MKTDRRSLLRFFGLGAAASVGEAMPGIGNVWIHGAPRSLIPPQLGEAATTGYAQAARTGSVEAIPWRDPAFAALDRYVEDRREMVLAEARAIEREREYAMTDWGGAF